MKAHCLGLFISFPLRWPKRMHAYRSRVIDFTLLFPIALYTSSIHENFMNNQFLGCPKYLLTSIQETHTFVVQLKNEANLVESIIMGKLKLDL